MLIDPYGAYLLLRVEPQAEGQPAGVVDEAGLGTVIGRGPDVVNYAHGPVIPDGAVVLFRGGTSVEPKAGSGHVYVAMGDILAVIEVGPGEAKPDVG